MTLLLVWAVPLTFAITACGGGHQADHGKQSGPRTAAQAPPAGASQQPTSAPPSSRKLKTLVLGLGDLPGGFVRRALTSRNLPSQLTGCQPLEALTAAGVGRHAQAEFFRAPIGPWLDEAVIVPAHRSAARLSTELAGAIAGCSSVTVTEEGERVRLALSPGAAVSAGQEAHAYRATGMLGRVPLTMDIVLIRSGNLVLLLTNTSLAGTADPSLTAKVARAAAARAARA